MLHMTQRSLLPTFKLRSSRVFAVNPHPQESLGGNAKTVLLVCVADVKEHADETLQSLQFAARAMCVKNKPVVNERLNYKVRSVRTMEHSAREWSVGNRKFHRVV